mgnify:CR=1 FL=1
MVGWLVGGGGKIFKQLLMPFGVARGGGDGDLMKTSALNAGSAWAGSDVGRVGRLPGHPVMGKAERSLHE